MTSLLLAAVINARGDGDGKNERHRTIPIINETEWNNTEEPKDLHLTAERQAVLDVS